jgi:hypothetical protein
MALDQLILTTLDPKLSLVELTDIDDSNTTKSLAILKKTDNRPTTAQTAGRDEPFIKINGYSVLNIEYFTIDETGFVPSVTLIFTDASGEFNGNSFPKTNMIMSSYIKVANEKFKPLRQDWLITSIRTMPGQKGNTDMGSGGIEYIIKGELFIPRLYNNVSKSYSKVNSKDALFKVAEELKIGFAENSVKPADVMTWINFNTSPSNFIRDVIGHSYQDEDSFFTAFINKEYCLNYLNINVQMQQMESDDTFTTHLNPGSIDMNALSKAEATDATTLNFLTTLSQSKGKPHYIVDISMLSDQGQILKKNGYKKKVYYYDHSLDAEPVDKFIDYFVAPTNTIGLPESQILLPESEGLSEVGLKKWMSIEYGNTHANWNHAKVANDINLKELEKVQLKVSLNGISFQVIRGSVVPLIITQRVAQQIRKDFEQDKASNPKNLTPEDEVPDTQLSGKYWVKGAKYNYDGATKEFSTELILARREWIPTKKTTTPHV